MAKRQRLAAILVACAFVLVLLFSFAPRYVARYLIASQLDELGIEYEGVDTLKINPWTQELWFGPVRFGRGTSDRGQLGELGLDLRFNPLLKRRVSIERWLLRGIDLVVTRGLDNTLALNGVPLSQFLTPPKAAEKPAEEDSPWGAGIDSFELRDSRLVFRDLKRGELAVDVERLALREFATWEPDRPGLFELAARANDIQLNWSGKARPFADNVTLEIDSRTEDADVPKVIRFTGPWGLDRQDGTYDAVLKYELTLFDSGRLEGRTFGVIDIQGANYERAGGFALRIERAKLDLDARYTLSDSGDFSLDGKLAADLQTGQGAVGEDIRFGVSAGRIALTGLTGAYTSDGLLRLELKPDLDLERLAFSGPIEISVDKLLDLLVLLQSLSGGTAVSTVDTGLADFADTSVAIPRSDITVGHLLSRGAAFSMQSNEGWADLVLNANSDLSDIQIVVGERTIRVEKLQSLLERLSLKSGHGRLALELAGDNSLVGGISVSPIGELNIAAFEAGVDRLDLEVRTGTVSLSLAAESRLDEASARVFAEGARPEAKVQLGGASASLNEASIDARSGSVGWALAGGAGIDDLSVEFADGKEGALRFERAEIKALEANERMQLAADSMTVTDLDLYVKRSLLAALAGDEEGGTENPVSAGDPKPTTEAEAPAPPPAAEEVDLGRIQALLTELGFAPGPVDGRMGQPTAAAIREFQRHAGLSVDGQPTSVLLAALESWAAGPERNAETDPPAGAPGQGKPAVKLGIFSLTGNSVLRFRDDLVTPQVKIDTVLEELRLQGLNTRQADQRANLSLIADVNEFTHLEVRGWVAGIGEKADLDLAAKVDDLELSNYSPYVARLAGVYLDSGQLDAESTAKAEQGALQGEIRLELDDLAFRPLSPEDAERLSATVGIPLETAVGLLQDGEGRIVLELPVSGPVSKPEVDISSAVNKAIGGVLKNVFPPTMVASMLTGIAKGTAPSFEPIEFAPGSAELGEAGRRYADDIADLLAEHPKLSLKVCGRSTALDLGHTGDGTGVVKQATDGTKRKGDPAPEVVTVSEQVKQALAELAVERKRAIRRYLIQERGADPKRVPECRSTFEAGDQGRPRVEISL